LIFVDDREGSKDLHAKFLRKYTAVLVRLDYADVMFGGQGPDGPVDIGIERKVIGDLLNSITTGRLSGHQLPGLVKDYYKSYILIEGRWRMGGDGVIEMYHRGRWQPIRHGRRYKYTEVHSYLTSLETMAGVSMRFTRTVAETIATVQSLYDWWQKDWEDHKAHMMMSKPQPTSIFLNPDGPSLLRRMAVELPGIGWERAKYVEAVFPTVERMVRATQKDWEEIPGIGKVTAKSAFNALRGE
jgi:ERCC4-type nuclease